MIKVTLYNNDRLNSNYVTGVLAAVLVFPAIGCFFNGYYVIGILLLAFWLSLDTIKKGIEVDFINGTITTFHQYLGKQLMKHTINIDKNKSNKYRIRKTSKSVGINTRVQTSSVSRMFYTIEYSYNNKNVFEELLTGDNETIHQLAFDMETTWNFIKVTKK